MENTQTDLTRISDDDLKLLRKFIETKDKPNIENFFKRVNVISLSEQITFYSHEEILELSKLMKPISLSVLFSYLETDITEFLIQSMSNAEIKTLFDNLHKDDIIGLFEDIEDDLVSKVLKNSSTKTREAVNKLLRYGEGVAGYEMNPDFLKIYDNYTIAQAIKKVRKKPNVIEDTPVLYIVSKDETLMGWIPIKSLIIQEESTKLSDILRKNVVIANVNEDIEDVTNKMRKFDLSIMPIVNDENKLKGVLTSDDILNIVVEEATEDIHKMNAITSLQNGYLQSSTFAISKSRIVWLVFLLFAASFSEILINLYDNSVEGASPSLILASVIPLIMATAGNAGGQASATVIRALAVGEITAKDYLKVMTKELRVAALIAALLFGANVGRMSVMGNFELNEILVISMALSCSIIIAKVLGGMLPLIAKVFKADPATMAGPITTTIVDIIAIGTLFTLYVVVIL